MNKIKEMRGSDSLSIYNGVIFMKYSLPHDKILLGKKEF